MRPPGNDHASDSEIQVTEDGSVDGHEVDNIAGSGGEVHQEHSHDHSDHAQTHDHHIHIHDDHGQDPSHDHEQGHDDHHHHGYEDGQDDSGDKEEEAAPVDVNSSDDSDDNNQNDNQRGEEGAPDQDASILGNTDSSNTPFGHETEKPDGVLKPVHDVLNEIDGESAQEEEEEEEEEPRCPDE